MGCLGGFLVEVVKGEQEEEEEEGMICGIEGES